MNGGEIHVVLSLALKMCAEQDTEVLLRSRRMRRTEFFWRLGRRACRESIAWLLTWPRVPTLIGCCYRGGDGCGGIF